MSRGADRRSDSRAAAHEAAELGRGRREQARRERELRRAERSSSPSRRGGNGAATTAERPRRDAIPAPDASIHPELVTLRGDDPSIESATRRRLPAGGAVSAVGSGLRSVPQRARGVARGFGLEVVAVLAGLARPVTRLAPSGGERSNGASPSDHAADATPARRGSGRAVHDRPAIGRRAPLTEAQQRAAARRRDLFQRRIRLVLAVALAASVVAAWVFVPASDAFRIRHVEVTGASSVGDLEVRQRVDRLLAGATVFTVDENAVEREIERLPFVRTATVHRHLPGGLELQVQEYRPLALGYGSGGTWLVARDGRVLAKARRDEWAGRVPLVKLRSDRLRPGRRLGDEPALRLLAAVPSGSTMAFQLIEATRFELVAQVQDASGTVEVRFGRTDQLRQKVLVAEKVLRDARRADRELLYLDVTVPSRPAPCPKATAACHLPRGPSEEATASATAAEETPVSPDERGGDEVDVASSGAR